MMPDGQGGFTQDMGYGLGNCGFDLEGMGLGFETQDAYENGARIVMNEPWFNDMFQHLPGSGNVFDM
ncbi:hypothetical protein G7046_g9705 [Stylonectria norvegica]|nr:hypothetical protein G7046_g9705 [Stylonectria norvegica]